MANNRTINPDQLVQQAMQAKLDVYQAKEHFESVLEKYNDILDNLVGLVNMMKERIIELEGNNKAETPAG